MCPEHRWYDAKHDTWRGMGRVRLEGGEERCIVCYNQACQDKQPGEQLDLLFKGE